jgi:23S rRNA pseudouridine1911/1915/1917 synthase
VKDVELTVPFLYLERRIDGWLAETLAGEFSRQEIKAAIEKGDITLNGRAVKPKAAIKEGDRIEGTVLSGRTNFLVPESIPLTIVHEDEWLLIVDKPAGMVVHPGAGNKKGTLVHALLGHGSKLSSLSGAERPGIVHRLDKDTSGLLIVAKNNKAHRLLQAQFEMRTLSKTYVALVRGQVGYEQGHVSEALARHTKLRGKMAVSKDEKAKEAETQYAVVKRFKFTTLLSVKILTGRTHQIRVHMAHLKHSVVGDEIYGTKQPGERLMLHAAKLQFIHPGTGESVEFESQWPDDFKAVVEKAEKE